MSVDIWSEEITSILYDEIQWNRQNNHAAIMRNTSNYGEYAYLFHHLIISKMALEAMSCVLILRRVKWLTALISEPIDIGIKMCARQYCPCASIAVLLKEALARAIAEMVLL